jgi:hypothetical protein
LRHAYHHITSLRSQNHAMQRTAQPPLILRVLQPPIAFLENLYHASL